MTQTTADLREYNNQLEQAHRERVAATLRKNNPLTVHTLGKQHREWRAKMARLVGRKS